MVARSGARANEMGKKRLDIESEIDRLYQQPLGSFVKERDTLARLLRSGGDRDGADRVKAQAKPGVAAWVMNQLHWGAKKELARWIGASRALGTLQPRAAGWPTALERRKAALDRLMGRAEELLTGAGHAASRGTLRRIETALDSLALRGEDDVATRPGRRTEDPEPAGLEALQLMALAPPPSPKEMCHAKSGKGPRPAAGKRGRSPATARAFRATLPAGVVDLAAERARRALEVAERELARRQEALEKAQLANEEAAAEATDARRELRRARDHANRVETSLRNARAATRRAGRALERAKQELTRARRKAR